MPHATTPRRTVTRLAAALLLAFGCDGPTDPDPPAALVYDGEPSWSPDGGTVAFVRTGGPRVAGSLSGVTPSAGAQPVGWRASREPAAGSPVGTSYPPPPVALLVVAADGGAPRAVAAEVTAPAWLPGARALLGVTTARRTLVRVPLDGAGGVVTVGDSTVSHLDPAVSPGGAVAVVSDRTDDGRRGGRARVHLLGAGGRLRPLAPLTGTGQDLAPSWGPGGRLAYQAWREGTGQQVVTADTASGAAPARVADGTLPAWSPTGEWIAYVRDPYGRSPTLHLVRPDGTGDRLLLQGDGDEGAVRGRAAWSPDGRRLAVARSTRAHGTAIWTVDVATGALRRLTAPREAR